MKRSRVAEMPKPLSPAQSAALFDILSHYDTYEEIRDFRLPGSLDHYGPPFTAEEQRLSTSPALQGLLSRFLLTLPGLKDVPEDFWKVQLRQTIHGLEIANLSESYDKGIVGSRKTVATAISALIEYPVRGISGGFSKTLNLNQHYDVSKADDLSRAFRDVMDGLIYGTALENLIENTAKTARLADHEPMIQAAHEYILVNMASFMHYTLILSPNGQYLLKLLSNANKLVPYIAIRQTLKIGNVASMISATMKVILAKMSVSSITNWLGLTQGQDEGMNLMQQIISTVLHWEIKDLEQRASKIETDKNGPTKDQIQCLEKYLNKSRQEQDRIRQNSQQYSISIVNSILRSSSLPADLSEPTHKLALEFLSLQLSIRDRREIILVLCHSSPDHVTTAVRTMVSAYEPVIRHIHNAVDLSDTLSDFEAFLRDMLKLSLIQPPARSGETVVPGVADFVLLLKKHQYSCHKFLHQCCKNGKELTGWYHEWAKDAASHFRSNKVSSGSNFRDAGDFTEPLNNIFLKLPIEEQDKILPILDEQSKYLDELHATSQRRLEVVLKSAPSKNPAIAKVLASSNSSRPSSRTPSPNRADKSASTPLPPVSSAASADPGPGAYLARWQDLLDKTPITPMSSTGNVKGTGSRGGVEKGNAKDFDGQRIVECSVGTPGPEKVRGDAPGMNSGKPDVRIVTEALGHDFRTLLGTRTLYW